MCGRLRIERKEVMLMCHLQRLLREQGGHICARLGHDMAIVLPLEVKKEARQFYGACRCSYKNWVVCTEEGFQLLLRDAKEGKL